MKVALEFESLLLKKSLDIYLKEYIVDKKDADFIISDYLVESDKPLFIVSHNHNATLKVPFTKEMLFTKLSEFAYRYRDKDTQERELDNMIAELEKKHRQKIERLIKEYYAKA